MKRVYTPSPQMFLLIICINISVLMLACRPTYKKEKITESVKEVAKREYKLDVDVKESGQTLGVRYGVKNLFGELMAEDQMIWGKVDHLMQVLSRIGLSSDIPPKFLVLEIFDEDNPRNKILFTQYMEDVKKVWAEALSRTQYLDRLSIEFVIGDERTPFDQAEVDLVRLMMVAMEASNAPTGPDKGFDLPEVQLPEFLSKVSATLVRRLFRENKIIGEEYSLRQAVGKFDTSKMENDFKLSLDLVSKPGIKPSVENLENKIFPLVIKELESLFRSYKFTGFKNIVVMDKNSGAMMMAKGK